VTGTGLAPPGRGSIDYVSPQPQGPDYPASYGPQFPVQKVPVSVKLDIECNGGGLYKTFRANGDAAPVGYGGTMNCGNGAEWATVTAAFPMDAGTEVVHCEPHQAAAVGWPLLASRPWNHYPPTVKSAAPPAPRGGTGPGGKR